ncbi:2435_t:CDS:2 [Diversispora eburnea]|uniref:2435_t:CDS:1 n=1 Tax=Diversispora eburnea TaxID=1213867 RepID=A0A9N8W078_9GLOM|nr:2435_t:CDS:2 [Diversispora eburnea]
MANEIGDSGISWRRDSCQLVTDYEMYPDSDGLKCYVVVTTVEAIAIYSSLFSRVPSWEILIVNETHSLKAGETTQELEEEYQGFTSVDQLPALHKLFKRYF